MTVQRKREGPATAPGLFALNVSAALLGPVSGYDQKELDQSDGSHDEWPKGRHAGSLPVLGDKMDDDESGYPVREGCNRGSENEGEQVFG